MAKRRKFSTKHLFLPSTFEVHASDDEIEAEVELGEQEGMSMLSSLFSPSDKTYLEDFGVLFLSGEVNQEKIDRIIQKLLVLHSQPKFTDPIQLVINSPGGYLNAGHALLDVMDYIKNPIRTIALGDIASMAAFIFINGDERIMGANATVMIHPFSGGNYGNYPHLVASRKGEDQYMNLHINLLMRKSKYKTKEEVLKNLLHPNDNYFTAQEMLKHGICDKIFVPGANKLSIDDETDEE